MKRILYILLFFSVCFGNAQTKLSEQATVSLITAGPGTALYEAFGHSTIRIKDTKNGFDNAYNFGIFDFDQPNFYLNFTKGYMLYKLARYPFYLFAKSYQRDNRWIKEQVLNLTLEQKQAFFDYLENNAKPENASYYYDPYYNNCASVLRDITKKVLGDKLRFHNKENSTKSLRKLMLEEIPWNSWGSVGIDIALGSKLDNTSTYEEQLYLPDYLFTAFEDATITKNGKNEPFVLKTNTILDFEEVTPKTSLFNPLLVFSLLMALVLWITYKDYKNKKRTKVLDFTLFFITGSIGVFILFLWFFTNHSTAPNNYNAFWAFAPNLFVAFVLFKKQTPKWLSKYLLLLLILMALFFVFWLLQVQCFPIAMLPLFLALVVRYWYSYKLNVSSN